MAEVLHTTWHGFEALALESELMRVVIVPDLGGKIASLYDKTHEHEWFAPPLREPKRTHYGDVFIEQDMSGWVETLPSMDACTVMQTDFPDHGEVWSVPWMVELGSGQINLAVEGTARPYRLTRAASLVAADELELHYRLRNTGEGPLPYLYTAHPQFAAGANTRLQLPPEVTQVVNVVENDPTWGAAGKLHPWPGTKSAATPPLDRLRPVETGSGRKFTLLPDQRAQWAGLVEPDLGVSLRMSWSPADLPYLGLWFDEGQYHPQPVVAIEPSSGYYDSLARAVANNRVSLLEPGAGKSWKIRVRLGEL